MRYRRLGRTDLQVSLLGLGSGGASQLGQRYELPPKESARLVRHALDVGVNLLDTAPAYGHSEELLGQALRGVPRDQYVLCTKFGPTPFGSEGSAELRPAESLRQTLEQSLRELHTDHVEVLYLHGIGEDEYAEVCERFVPEMQKARDDGLIRWLGVSERYQSDHAHEMAKRAIPGGDFDVLMAGFNVMSPAAVTSVLPLAAEYDVGVVVMCAVRSVLVRPDAVAEYVRRWEAEGLLQPGLVEPESALDWLLDEHTPDIAAAAYKFAAEDPAVGSVLTGTASVDHFDANLEAILGPPLPAEKYQRVLDVFGPVERNVQPAQRSGRGRGA